MGFEPPQRPNQSHTVQSNQQVAFFSATQNDWFSQKCPEKCPGQPTNIYEQLKRNVGRVPYEFRIHLANAAALVSVIHVLHNHRYLRIFAP